MCCVPLELAMIEPGDAMSRFTVAVKFIDQRP
jgi:hypothetical protein